MVRDDRMPVETDPETMWTLSADRATVRLALPPLPLNGRPERLQISLDFDAATA
jgi:hypothetical protein